MPAEPDLDGLHELLRHLWPDASLAELSVGRLSRGRNADTWRVRRGDEAFVLRVTDGEVWGTRVVAALEALEGESFAPRLLGWQRAPSDRHLIAMEEIIGPKAEADQVQQRRHEFIDIIRRLHAHPAFGSTVDAVGSHGLSEDTAPPWVENEWRRLQEIAPSDARVERAARWRERARTSGPMKDLVNSVIVCGHGDLHRENWRLSDRGPVLIDWEDMGRYPLALELASFIVFGRLDPVEVAERYGVSKRYLSAIKHEAAMCALGLYLYWLRRLIDGSDPRPDDLAHAAGVCDRYFS